VAEQASSGTMAEPGQGASEATADTGAHGLDSVIGPSPKHEAAHHGRPASWVAVSIIIVGFTVGGVAMVPHPKWWLFWTGTGIVVIGAILATTTRIFDDWY
jgi:hypothetical protein